MAFKPIIVLSDIHANQPALETVVRDIGMPREAYHLFYLGDLFGRGPMPAQVYYKIQHLQPEVWLSGNHDHALNPQSKCYHTMQSSDQVCIEKHRIALDQSIQAEISGKPVKQAKGPFYCSHGFPLVEDSQSVEAYDFEYSPRDHSETILSLWTGNYEDTNIWLVGHSHVQKLWWFSRQLGAWHIYPSSEPMTVTDYLSITEDFSEGRKSKVFTLDKTFIQDDLLILNPGSVGFPRDGMFKNENGYKSASYLVIRNEDDQLSFEFVTLSYSFDTIMHFWMEAHYPYEALSRRI